jgi:hypothetical protein
MYFNVLRAPSAAYNKILCKKRFRNEDCKLTAQNPEKQPICPKSIHSKFVVNYVKRRQQ